MLLSDLAAFHIAKATLLEDPLKEPHAKKAL
jgi:hypothetical protein